MVAGLARLGVLEAEDLLVEVAGALHVVDLQRDVDDAVHETALGGWASRRLVLDRKALLGREIGGEVRDVRPGSIVFVAATVDHRFHDIVEDLTLLVVFGPAEGSRAAANPTAVSAG